MLDLLISFVMQTYEPYNHLLVKCTTCNMKFFSD